MEASWEQRPCRVESSASSTVVPFEYMNEEGSNNNSDGNNNNS